MNENESTYVIRDASKSFPSGHASISVYGSISMAVSMKFNIIFLYLTTYTLQVLVSYYFYNLVYSFKFVRYSLNVKNKLTAYSVLNVLIELSSDAASTCRSMRTHWSFHVTP